ncbi:hypothetical protein LTR53_017218, partial [Teratosphaeriaceae sp. CCFEE 6253]
MAAFPQPTTNAEAVDLINRFVQGYAAAMPPTNFDQPFNRACRCVAATLESPISPATATFHLTIPPTYLNSPDPASPTIHGGAMAQWFDATTSMPLLCVRKVWAETWSGVTRSLSVTYLRPPKEGEEIVIEAEVIQCARRMATVRGVMKRRSDGAVLATCQHDKARPE